MAWGRVADRVEVLKSCCRTLIVTVRAKLRPSASRPVTRSVIIASSAASLMGSVTSTSNVSSADTLLASRSTSTSRSSSARAAW